MPLIIAAIILIWGLVRAYTQGAPDFNVFYIAWQHILHGRASVIYTDSPDRFLYSPGFAWLLAPIGLLPRWAALGTWSLLKAGLLLTLVGRMSKSPWKFLAIPLVARPLLIDFGYGQINTLVLAFSGLFLLEKSQSKSRMPLSVGAGFIAGAKLITLPLILGARSTKSRLAFLAGTLLAFAPWTFSAFSAWLEAIKGRGFPLESHNQSFSAILFHLFGGMPTKVLFLPDPVSVGIPLLSASTIRILGMGWALVCIGWICFWSVRKNKNSAWCAVLLGSLILPLHLVWKPYFVFSIPLALIVLESYPIWVSGIFFLAINLTSFDFVGIPIAAVLEAGGLFFWIHLVLLCLSVNTWRLSSADK